jgi:competence protein ComEA
MFKIVKQFFSEFTYFSASARKATLVLIVLIILSLVTPTIYLNTIDSPSETPDSLQIKQYNAIITNLNIKHSPKYNIPDTAFDPNLLHEKDWINIGLDSHSSHNIIQYINKGGYIKKADDLLKIYGFDSSLYITLKPLIVITSLKQNKYKKDFIYKNKPIDLNKADSAQLVSLPGIGVVIASRIIKYKNLIGGYYNKEQLLEVFGIDNSLLDKIKNRLIVTNDGIVKINLNAAQYNQLRKHPYIGKEKTALILKLRKNKNIGSFNELVDNKIFTNNELKKLAPYLEL